jgi:hypothetical protein
LEKPATPTLDRLRGMPPGTATDVFRQVHSAAIGAEQRALDAHEQRAQRKQTTEVVQAARTAGLTHLATYREMQQQGRHNEADLYRHMNSRAVSDEQSTLERLNGKHDGPEAA